MAPRLSIRLFPSQTSTTSSESSLGSTRSEYGSVQGDDHTVNSDKMNENMSKTPKTTSTDNAPASKNVSVEGSEKMLNSGQLERKLVQTPMTAATDDTTASNFGSIDSPRVYHTGFDIRAASDYNRTPVESPKDSQVSSPIFTMDSPKHQDRFLGANHGTTHVEESFLSGLGIKSPASIPLPTSPAEEEKTSETPTKRNVAQYPDEQVNAPAASFFSELAFRPKPDTAVHEIQEYKLWLKMRIDVRADPRIVSNWRHAPITRAVVNDAHQFEADMVKSIAELTGREVFGRPAAKSLTRVHEKQYAGTGFYALNDVMACRVLIPGVSHVGRDIEVMVRLLDRALRGDGCKILDRHTMDGTHYDGTRPIKDIVAYLQIFVPHLGHVMEIQVLHPFAAVQLARNALIERTDPRREEGYIDLWDEWFYEDVKEMLLGWNEQFVGYPWERGLSRLVKSAKEVYPSANEKIVRANEQLVAAVWEVLIDKEELWERINSDDKAFV